MPEVDCITREKILNAALKEFADRGYSGASVQAIVDGARVTKPTLYYYFANKAALYEALVNSAHDERFRLIEQAAREGKTLREKLVKIITAMFAFLESHRELMRLAFATAFAAPGELPPGIECREKAQRNFDLVQALIRKELKEGRLNRDFTAAELTAGIWGVMNIYVMRQLVHANGQLDRKTAEHIVDLFFNGAEKVK